MKIEILLAVVGVVCTCGFAEEVRADYIGALWTYQRAVGSVSCARPDLLPAFERLAPLKGLVRTWWKATLDLVAEAREG